MVGYSLTPKSEIPIPPKSRMARDITMAKTGLLILILERLAMRSLS
jgi:hypothetical protein